MLANVFVGLHRYRVANGRSQEPRLIQPLAIAALAGAATLVGACGAPQTEQVSDNSFNQGTGMKSGSADQPAHAPINRRFKSLDDYLAWLRRTQEPVDGSWYEEIRPGIYQLRNGNLRILGPGGDETPPGQTFTRAELEKKFGFSR
jgi:hypothetical protein